MKKLELLLKTILELEHLTIYLFSYIEIISKDLEKNFLSKFMIECSKRLVEEPENSVFLRKILIVNYLTPPRATLAAVAKIFSQTCKTTWKMFNSRQRTCVATFDFKTAFENF